MRLQIPELSLVALVGASGSGKSSFAASHFAATEVLSSDRCRGLVADDENDQSATRDVFDILHYIAGKRLASGRLAVVDATSTTPDDRKPLVALARAHHVLPVAIVFDVPEQVCLERNTSRPDRDFGPHVVRRQHRAVRRSLRSLQREGFRRVNALRSVEEVDAAVIEREPVWSDRRSDHGPFDIVGDIHGCIDELTALLQTLGYKIELDASGRAVGAKHADARRMFFVGDLVDRGPDSPAVLRLAMGMVAAGDALAVPGNHEAKLLKALRGRNVTLGHGLAERLAQLEAEPAEFRTEVERFIDGLVSHLVVDDGKLVVAHAGLRQDMQMRASAAVRSFCLYGDTTGETDEYGLPVRYPWADDYRGRAVVAYGHTPAPSVEWVNNTICLDTGCVFGGSLTALRWPERELVSVPAARTYYEPVRPLVPVAPADTRPADLLDLDDVVGRRQIETRLMGSLKIREENAAAALEVMSRFAVDPHWLVYLPPTMSPPATSNLPGMLEHPAEAFAAYRDDGIASLVCEEKHMGSRAVVVACREPGVASRRFGVANPEAFGVIVTRTGRQFFSDQRWEAALIDRMRDALERSGVWDDLDSDWVVLDTELLPWSAKAQDLLRTQYAAVGAAATGAVPPAVAALEQAAARGVAIDELLIRTRLRGDAAERFREAYRAYCWHVESVDDVRIAPFQVLAAEGAVHAERAHAWHLSITDRLVTADPGTFRATRAVTVDTTDETSMRTATAWWDELTGSGGEGMVVKPAQSVERGPRGLVQPGVKCRGPEYLRIIYGPDYDQPHHLERLRRRGLGRKRGLALREFALGLEALHRFVEGEPLWRVHECVFAVLALESEPVDPRL